MSKQNARRELEVPPIATSESDAVEAVRVWASPGHSQQVTLRTTWNDPGAWGLMLADIARHAVKAYTNEGRDPAEVLARIREMFEAEFANPTDTPIQLN